MRSEPHGRWSPHPIASSHGLETRQALRTTESSAADHHVVEMPEEFHHTAEEHVLEWMPEAA